MSKAYLLVVCLLAASFMGCLADDTSDSIEQGENTEEETIEPVGTHNNETSEYDALIGEIQNLTDEIEELRLEIEELQASEYQPPENSNFTISDYREWYGGENQLNWNITPMFRYIKEGHTLVIEYIGPSPATSSNHWNFNETELYCYEHFPSISVYNIDGVKIDGIYSNYGSYSDGGYAIENLCEYNYEVNNNDHYFNGFNYWSRITKTFDEEPVRIGFGTSGDGVSYTFQ